MRMALTFSQRWPEEDLGVLFGLDGRVAVTQGACHRSNACGDRLAPFVRRLDKHAGGLGLGAADRDGLL